jgi:hypothetical protein
MLSDTQLLAVAAQAAVASIRVLPHLHNMKPVAILPSSSLSLIVGLLAPQQNWPPSVHPCQIVCGSNFFSLMCIF